jgi:hypothetical protein
MSYAGVMEQIARLAVVVTVVDNRFVAGSGRMDAGLLDELNDPAR